ncbi:hypothetical protein [Lysinibacillus irui]|uniref:hypothetical protein n=1 Tax=Lysinibacillus irui TaxID=2998077 RepID=UPI002AD4C3A3|nr:hypothetical protein [Lysinibacillus irui]MEA0564473.1 hypothetical protein [Lysinibacillus irui]
MSLLNKLEKAVQNSNIPSTFTTQDLKTWITQYNIKNDQNNLDYQDSYIESFLSSSTVNGSSTKWDKRLVQLGTNPESYQFI